MILKSKKFWIVVIALLVIIATCGVGAKVYFNEKNNKNTLEAQSQVYRQVCEDLLYLEQFETLKVKPEQAKQISPLMDKLLTADSTAQPEMAKQIYGALTAVQYEALLSDQRNNVLSYGEKSRSHGKDKGRGRDGFKGKDRRGAGEGWFGHNNQDPRVDAMGNVVSKMLKDRANESAAVQTPQ